MIRTPDGWTDFPLTNGDRAIYVSTSGSDTNDGLTELTPVKSVARAYSLLRDGTGDQLLLKAGDTWDVKDGFAWPPWNKSGASVDRPLVIGTWGGTDRANIISGTYSGMVFNGNGSPIRFVAIQNINLTPYGYDGQNANISGIEANNGCQDFFLENLCITGYTHGISVEWAGIHDGQPQPQRWVVRRSLILDSFHHVAHAQGVWGGYVDGFTLDECILDHNGWKNDDPLAQPVQYNHNTYFNSDCTNVHILGCISTRASQNGLHFRGGGVIRDCLLVDNPCNIAVGGSGHDVALYHNTILGTVRFGEGIDVADAANLTVVENLVVHANASNLPMTIGIRYQTTPTISLREAGNIVEDWGQSIPATLYPDSNRNIASYMQHLGLPASLATFFHQIRLQSRSNWRSQLTVGAVTAWVRAGFGMQEPASA